jgi:hypothetical protein
MHVRGLYGFLLLSRSLRALAYRSAVLRPSSRTCMIVSLQRLIRLLMRLSQVHSRPLRALMYRAAPLRPSSRTRMCNHVAAASQGLHAFPVSVPSKARVTLRGVEAKFQDLNDVLPSVTLARRFTSSTDPTHYSNLPVRCPPSAQGTHSARNRAPRQTPGAGSQSPGARHTSTHTRQQQQQQQISRMSEDCTVQGHAIHLHNTSASASAANQQQV